MSDFEKNVYVESLRITIHDLKRELKELNKKYNELKKRYIAQNDELCSYKIKLSKVGYYDNNRSK